MEDDDKINIKLELNRDKNQNLSLLTYFNLSSSNFFKEGDNYIWKPTLKEKEFIIDAFRLIINSNINNNGEKLFKFSDKISNMNNEIKDSNNKFFKSNNEKISQINNNSKLDIEKIDNKSQKNKEIINDAIEKNKIKENKLLEDERDRKIEKILRDNKKIN